MIILSSAIEASTNLQEIPCQSLWILVFAIYAVRVFYIISAVETEFEPDVTGLEVWSSVFPVKSLHPLEEVKEWFSWLSLVSRK